ncbi:TPA: hypothetical protein ACX3GK_004516 [Vibrio parahaemolyticus]|uniref:hypothetical protein n=1 Tax=Vibrio parahaemolyticus TaxID=670 RepID=UPI00081380B6|nr:hypothetical protein [Vibrio parahaemolyticus]MBE5178165.1 hypothetical protein [Vibrio parahaemolyticus]MDF4849596.1 hypothetical protein [Vibrio parahaemolyticus]OCP53055.1 hypothetical protein AKH04_21820 [Vibrio parahaemolyticus]HAS6506115.1 hypothetical protein [Vibrio parahaemolyticus]HCE4548103.1 hypothetical protein [Vibrio parahaemolyticus]
MSEQENSKKFSKREWIQLIITLSIIQAFFWYAVFENSQSASALGYVSFAGTLVSIILAVLAIGYTYGESISQKSKSDGLAEQIKTLGTLIKSVEIEAKSLEKIQDISSELSTFVVSYKDDKKSSEKNLHQIRHTVESLTKRQIHDDLSNTPVNAGPITQLEMLTKKRSPLDEVCYLLLVYIEENQEGLGFHEMDEILEEVLTETPMGLHPAFFKGALYTQSSILGNLNYLNIDDEGEFGKLTIDPEFKQYILENMLGDKQFISRDYKNMITTLRGLIGVDSNES